MMWRQTQVQVQAQVQVVLRFAAALALVAGAGLSACDDGGGGGTDTATSTNTNTTPGDTGMPPDADMAEEMVEPCVLMPPAGLPTGIDYCTQVMPLLETCTTAGCHVPGTGR